MYLTVLTFIGHITEIPYAGEVEVGVKVSRETFAACPSFKLRVMSPLETIFQAASTPQKSCSPNGSAPLACLAAYLLHTHEKDQNRLGHMDKVVSGLLQSQSSICSDWDLSSVVFGKRKQQNVEGVYNVSSTVFDNSLSLFFIVNS